jgi:hypothetical protein
MEAAPSPPPADDTSERLKALGVDLPDAEYAVIARGRALLQRWLDRVRRDP